MIVREARPADLDDVVALQREDVIREVREDDVPVSAYRAAFDEITSDAQRDAARRFYERLGFVASHIGMKYYLGGER